MRRTHPEAHLMHRIGWLRAAVLGANDGIVSTASLIVGVAAAAESREAILLAGTAGLVAGAMSMAAGEYISVSSQADTETADLARERKDLARAWRGRLPRAEIARAARSAHDCRHSFSELGATEPVIRLQPGRRPSRQPSGRTSSFKGTDPFTERSSVRREPRQRGNFVGIIWTIIIGFLAGVIAKFLMPGKNEPSGFVLTTILGIVGAFVATFLGQSLGWYGPNEGAGLVGAAFGAIVVLAAWGFFARRA